MNATNPEARQEGPHNLNQPCEDAGTIHPENSTVACPQNEGLSSTNEDLLRKLAAYLRPLHWTKGGYAVYSIKYAILTILPDLPEEACLKMLRALDEGGHPDIPGPNGQNGSLYIDRYLANPQSFGQDDT